MSSQKQQLLAAKTAPSTVCEVRVRVRVRFRVRVCKAIDGRCTSPHSALRNFPPVPHTHIHIP